jgi:hypothetical protein
MQLAAATVAAIALIGVTAEYQFPRPFVPVTETKPGYLVYETAYRAVGTTAGGEFLSSWAEAPPRSPAITRDLSRTALVDAPAGVSAEMVNPEASALDLKLAADKATPVTVAQFFFPGWRGFLDGQAVALRPAEGTGLIALDLPAGRHELRLVFGDTAVRRTAGALALAGLVLGIVVTVVLRPQPPATAPISTLNEARRFEPAVLSVVLAAVGVGIVWVAPHTAWFCLSSPPGRALPAQHATDIALDDQVRLIGYDLDRSRVRQGDELIVRLYWQSSGPLDQDYASFLQLAAGADQQTFATSDHQHPGNIPTRTWSAGQYVVDEHRLIVPDDAPPVAYDVVVGLYSPENQARRGNVALPESIHVTQATPVDAAGMDRSSATRFGQQIRLLGHAATAETDGLRVTLYWQAAAPIPQDYQVFLHVLDDSGRIVGQVDGPPLAGLYPTSRWLPGQIIADTYSIPLNPETRPVALRAGLYDLGSLERLPAQSGQGQPRPDNAAVIPLPALP